MVEIIGRSCELCYHEETRFTIQASMSQSPKFYTDVHVSKEAVRQLRAKGVDIVHCSDVSMDDASDEAHLEYATEEERVLISCDEDFEQLHAEWQDTGHEHAGIIRLRMPDQCKSIGLIVREILFLHEAADYKIDLYNQLWRVKS
jgi:predicted nuclease of predicted toxin-antitoxin system